MLIVDWLTWILSAVWEMKIAIRIYQSKWGISFINKDLMDWWRKQAWTHQHGRQKTKV